MWQIKELPDLSFNTIASAVEYAQLNNTMSFLLNKVEYIQWCADNITSKE